MWARQMTSDGGNTLDITLAGIPRIAKALLLVAWALVIISLPLPAVRYMLGAGFTFVLPTAFFVLGNFLGRPLLFVGAMCFIAAPAALAWRKPIVVDIAFRCLSGSVLYVWHFFQSVERGSSLCAGYYLLSIGLTISFLTVLLQGRAAIVKPSRFPVKVLDVNGEQD